MSASVSVTVDLTINIIIFNVVLVYLFTCFSRPCREPLGWILVTSVSCMPGISHKLIHTEH